MRVFIDFYSEYLLLKTNVASFALIVFMKVNKHDKVPPIEAVTDSSIRYHMMV